MTNPASASCPDGTADVRSSAHTNTITTSATLAVTKSDGKASMDAGSQTTYTITATNNSPSTSQSLILTDTLGAGLGSGSICEVAGTVDCTQNADFTAYTSGSPVSLSMLTPTQTRPFTLRASAAANLASGSSLTNTASPPSLHSFPTRRSSDLTNTITTSATLAVTKSDGKASMDAGSQTT